MITVPEYDIAVSAHSEISILELWPMRKQKNFFLLKTMFHPFSIRICIQSISMITVPEYDIAVSAHSEISILELWPMRKQKTIFLLKTMFHPFSMPK